MENLASSGLFITTPEVSDEKASVKITGKVSNKSGNNKNIEIATHILSPNNKIVAKHKEKNTVPANEKADISLNFNKIENPVTWSPEDPALYTVITQILDTEGNILDEIRQLLGFRWFSVDAKKGFFLNGKPYKIKGAARHQDYHGIGTAIPNDLQHKDMKLLKEMGANFVRISHYPQDPAIYQACDKLGLIAWSEIPIVNEITLNDTFFNNCDHMLREMILQNYNHPSVMMWGFMNEVLGAVDWFWSDKPADSLDIHKKETGRLAKRLQNTIDKLDPGRLSVIAYHTDPNPQFYEEANLMHLVDMNGWNIYQGWYHNNLDSVGKYLDYFYSYHPERPLFISEYGAGSDPRIHTNNPTIFDFSTEYQDEFHKVYLREGNKRDFVAGFAIWNFIDFEREGRGDAVPHVNSKGVVTTEREPKDVYYLYQAYWSEKPMVHIASNHWTKRVRFSPEKSVNELIRIYSNQPEAELIHNGKSLGSKPVKNHEATWEVRFIDGNNQLEAAVKPQGKTIKDFIEIEMTVLPDNLSEMNEPFESLNINVGQSSTYFTEEITETVWVPDSKYREGLYGFQNGNYYRNWSMVAWQDIREGVSQNIKGTTIDPVFQTFLVGVTNYKVHCPTGRYQVDLYFAEPFSENDRKDPAKETGADINGQRAFDVAVNEQIVIKNLNLSKEFGDSQAVIKSFFIEVKNNKSIDIHLEPVKGQPVLSGVKIKRR
jgi:beta-galactosidase